VLVLALDTTTRTGSVAVVGDDRVRSTIVGDASRTHGERLPGDLMRAVEAAGVSVGQLELLAVAAGPGSFTGLRVGIAAMQGLASALGLRIVPVSALDALALAAAQITEGRGRIATWIDAQRGEVFAALYDASGVHGLVAPTALSPARTLSAWAPLSDTPMHFIGDGAARYADLIRTRLGGGTMILPAPMLALTIAGIASRSPERAVSPHAVVPIYIRRPDAELARERRGDARS
jgi:tRNA threonylcarbamoyladenosine biosynthesis protein TsaB